MTRKTEGLVLRTIKYQENHLITTIYTEAYGLQSFIIKGYYSARSRRKHSYFQPLSIIEVVFFYKKTQSLQKVSESKLVYLLRDAQSHPIKLSLGLTIVEMFYDTVKEEETNQALYHFLKSIIIQLDQSEQQLIHIFLFFLVRFTKHLGFFPSDQSQGSQYVSFDLTTGILTSANRKDAVADLIRQFMMNDLNSCQNIYVERSTKRAFIKTLFAYYKRYVDGFKYPQTLRVFAEVFD